MTKLHPDVLNSLVHTCGYQLYSFIQSHIKVVAEETGYGVDSKIAVVWDFEHISAMCAIPPDEKPADDC